MLEKPEKITRKMKKKTENINSVKLHLILKNMMF